MILVFAIAAVLWGIGMAMGAPHRARWTMIGILMAAVMLGHLVLPDGHPLRQATGGDLRLWLLVFGFVALAYGYRFILRRLRERAHEAEAAPVQTGTFSETELHRYARHMIMREIGGLGQKRLKEAKVLVVGAGGLGSPALLYLAAAGVGSIGVIDDDVVDSTNLQRQVIHTDDRIGTAKVLSAAKAMTDLNPFIKVFPIQSKLTRENAESTIAPYDLVLDGTDNFETRYLVNATCVALKKPLISAAITQWEGQISLYDPANGAPCYQCVFPEAPAQGLAPSCAVAGVAGPLPGVVGAMMALEAVKETVGAGEGLRGRMMIYDGLYAETRVMKLARRADCPICGLEHRGSEG